jgi:hypothetical protein
MNFALVVASLALASGYPHESPQFWSEIKDLTLRCAVQPYALDEAGNRIYAPIRSNCASSELEISGRQARFSLEGNAYVATLEDSEDADQGDLNHLRIADSVTGAIVAEAENVLAFGEVAIALVGGDDRFVEVPVSR